MSRLKSHLGSFIFLTTTLFCSQVAQLWAQELTTKAPPQATAEDLPEAPPAYPVARVVPAKDEASDIKILADTQTTKAGHFTLDGNVVITYGDRTVEADHVEYDRTTGDLEATGHLVATGGTNQERIEASHGTMNLKTQTGRFYDVKGSVGIKKKNSRLVYTNGNPFLFTGRLVVKKGPQAYDVYDGSITSCALPHPDWILSAGHFNIDGERAKASNSIFHLVNVPVLYLPYVTHAVDTEDRQSGFLIPVISQSSSKGLIIGEQVYFAINRSIDLTVGAEYFSLRGYSQMATFRYRGRNDDFARAHYSGLLDRLQGSANQGGEDFVLSGRHDFDPHTRVATDLEYLSSFTYRAAFSESFNQAVSSDILSDVYLSHDHNGYVATGLVDRYQGLKRIASIAADSSIIAAEQVRIFHVPSLDLSSVDRALGRSGFVWNFDVDASGLKRVQPNFQTAGVVERFDLHPVLSYPLNAGGWHLRPSIGARETYYNRSRSSVIVPNPTESTEGINRSDVEIEVDARAPVIERTFDSGFLRRVLGSDVKHTVEPAVTYRYVTGINRFANILRFDDRDLASDTNEIEYGVTQRLFLRPRARKTPCTSDAEQIENPLLSADDSMIDTPTDSVAPQPGCGTREWITWRLTQKYFLDPTFGGAVQTGRRNLFDSTLDFSGIAFLTEPREISPLISRLRLRASEKVDFEWDVDYDTGAKKFTADNFFVDVHEGVTFAGLSYARLNAPGRSYSEGIASAVSDFSQMRVLLGFGAPTRAGLSVAGNAGLDLNVGSVQYAALQTSYNWDCCGFSVEYRKYELGSVRNENVYRFNITLANIGTAGNLKRAERLF